MSYPSAENISSIVEVPDSNKSLEAEEHLGKTRIHTGESLFYGLDYHERDNLTFAIYENYADAIRMRGREPLEEEAFVHHFFEGGNYEKSVFFGGRKDGFLLGNDMDGVFVPTHFAPASLRGGYRLIKGLLEEDIPTALFITDDLVATVEKMHGWKVLPFKLQAKFRGKKVEKTLVVNKWDVLPKLAVGQATKLVNSTVSKLQHKLRSTKYYLEEFGEKVKDLFGLDNANGDELDDEIAENLVAPKSLKSLLEGTGTAN